MRQSLSRGAASLHLSVINWHVWSYLQFTCTAATSLKVGSNTRAKIITIFNSEIVCSCIWRKLGDEIEHTRPTGKYDPSKFGSLETLVGCCCKPYLEILFCQQQQQHYSKQHTYCLTWVLSSQKYIFVFWPDPTKTDCHRQSAIWIWMSCPPSASWTGKLSLLPSTAGPRVIPVP